MSGFKVERRVKLTRKRSGVPPEIQMKVETGLDSKESELEIKFHR